MNEKTRKDEVVEGLRAIASSVTPKMRARWALDNDLSARTVDKYLTGSVATLIIGEKLLADMNDLLNTVTA